MNNQQNPLDKLKSVDWRGLVRTATNKVKQYTMNLSPLEIMVEEATNMDQWGPHGSVMSDISEACFDPEGYRQVLGVLARRLQEKDERWRMCYKSLLLLEFLLKHGPTKTADDVLSSMSVLERLQRFQYKDDNGRDHGANVRHRAEELIRLVNDPSLLREEREKARANKAKYTGVSADDMRRGATGFGSGSSGMSGRGGFDRSTLVRPGGGATSGSGSTMHSSGGGSMSGFGSGSQSWDRPTTTNTTKYHGDDDVDAVSATRARIEKLKLEQQQHHGSSSSSSHSIQMNDSMSKPSPHKKKLMDVKVNPKIAQSLGLKLAPPPPQQQSSLNSNSNTQMFDDHGVDLLGGLEEDQEEDTSGGVGDINTTINTTTNDINSGWDAFGSDGTTINATTAAAAFDPFAQIDNNTTHQPSSSSSPQHTNNNNTTPSMPVIRTALPEDAFSDLTGLNKPLQPMATAPKSSPTITINTSNATINTTNNSNGGGGGGFADFDAFSSPPTTTATNNSNGNGGFDAFSSPTSASNNNKGVVVSSSVSNSKDPDLFADLLG